MTSFTHLPWLVRVGLSAGAICLVASLLPHGPAVAADTAPWALAAREGGCFPIQSLRRRLPDLPDVRDPDGFQQYLVAKGWVFQRTAPAGGAVSFTVESQGLALLFVTRERCSSAATR